MVTEAAQQVLGERAVGICDSPSGLCRRVARALGRAPGELTFDYFGLNHLGWLRAVRDGGEDLLPALLADDERLGALEDGRLFGAEWLRTLRMIPNEYLYYFYFGDEAIEGMREAPRGEYLLAQQRAFYGANGDALAAWRAARAERDASYMAEAGVEGGHEADDAGGYEGEAMAVVEAIATNARAELIVNVANASGAAVPRRARGRRGALAGRSLGPPRRSPSATCPTTRGR